MNDDERSILTIRAGAAGLRLPAERLDALLPGLRRLEATARWLRAFDLDFEEPALIFDVPPAGPDGGAVGRE